MTDPCARNEQGFVLLAVLGLTGVIGAIILALSLSTRDDYREMKLHLDLVKARLHADNAIIRAIAALGDPADPLHGVLLQPGGAYIFRLNEVDVLIRVEHESGKIDLNRADPAFILNALRRVAPDSETAEAMHARVMALRTQNVFIGDIGAMLSMAQQFDPIAGWIERVFTVATGARGVAAHLAGDSVFRRSGSRFSEKNASRGEDSLMAAIPGILPEELELLALGRAVVGANLSPVLTKYQAYLSSSRPIYTIRAKVADKTLPPLRRKAMIALGQVPIRRHTDIAVLMWRGEN